MRNQFIYLNIEYFCLKLLNICQLTFFMLIYILKKGDKTMKKIKNNILKK